MESSSNSDIPFSDCADTAAMPLCRFCQLPTAPELLDAHQCCPWCEVRGRLPRAKSCDLKN